MLRAQTYISIVGLAITCLFLAGCGLEREDFMPISEGGFEYVDHQRDGNDYAWAMEQFTPDTGPAYLYVGTGNNLAALMNHNILLALGLVTLDESPARPPEIRRYRPDLGAREWERVMDYRDYEDPPYETIGFRFMKAYRAKSDGRAYLYAATMGTRPAVWRSSSGDPGSWELVWVLDEIGAVRSMEPHPGLLYIAVSHDVPTQARPGQVWATDGATFWPVMQDGFGDPANRGVMALASYRGWLYAGTANYATGYEIWKLAGPRGEGPTRVIGDGGPDPRNEIAGTMAVFNDRLYVGSLIFLGFNFETLNGFKGFDLIRIGADDAWETIVGPDGLSGFDSGFNRWTNPYCWWLEPHDGWLYLGTYDMSTTFRIAPDALAQLIENLKIEPDAITLALGAGADLYKSADGVTWLPVTTDGFGDPGNYGIRTMRSVDDTLYVGTTNPYTGLEIWAGRAPEAVEAP